MMHLRLPCVLAVALALTLAGGSSAMAQSGEKDPSTAEKNARSLESAIAKAGRQEAPRDPDTKVYTNEDLTRMFGGGAASEAPAPDPQAPAATRPAPTGKAAPSAEPEGAEEPADPLLWIKNRKAAAAEKARMITEAELRVNAARERIATLEKRRLAASNPFLPRAEPPGKDEAGHDTWSQMNGAERVKLAEDELARAREELTAAEAALARLQRAP